MKKHQLKKRIFAILISISMLISAIVMISIPIKHVSAEGSHPPVYAEPIMLSTDDDDKKDSENSENIENTESIENIESTESIEDIEGTENIEDINENNIIDSMDDEAIDNDTENIEKTDNNDASDISDNVEHNTDNHAESDVCDNSECEYCEGECICDDIDRSMLRSEILIASNVNNFLLLNNIINADITTNQAANFGAGADADTINEAIKEGTPVVIRISTGFAFTSTITIEENRDITIVSQTGLHALQTSGNFRHFVIKQNAELTLQSIIIRADIWVHPTYALTRGGITVDGGKLTANAGAEINNNLYNEGADGGGGVTIFSGEFIMNKGSKVTGNRANPSAGPERGGGGVYVGENGRFILDGGEIINNLSTPEVSTTHFLHTGGGGVYVQGYFEFRDGKIENNRTVPARGNQNGGGGVFVGETGTMVMYNGLITRNRGDREATSIWSGGGGIFAEGTVEMHGGRIHNNFTNWEGGGVFLSPSGLFTMYEGEITDNVTENSTSGHGGAGVLIMGGRFITANPPGEVTEKIIRGNRSASNAGAFSVRGNMHGSFMSDGILTIVDGTVITGNRANAGASANIETSIGGAIMIVGDAIVNLYGGEIYNNVGGNSKSITWVEGTINVKGNPRVGRTNDTDSIHRYNQSTNPDQVINIVGPLGRNAHINVRDLVHDKGRPNNSENELTVIAERESGNATNSDAEAFHYMGTGNPRNTWRVLPHTPNRDKRLVLSQTPTGFALLRVPDDIHFGERPLLTTNLVGPYGDAPKASDVLSDFDEGVENWHYGFEVINTIYNNWSLVLQATPFTNRDGIIGATPIAVSKDTDNPETTDLSSTHLTVTTKRNERGESIKWHWTQLDYKIEAQTALDTVAEGEFQSVFTWTLQIIPTG